jgi:hypothetical protein
VSNEPGIRTMRTRYLMQVAAQGGSYGGLGVGGERSQYNRDFMWVHWEHAHEGRRCGALVRITSQCTHYRAELQPFCLFGRMVADPSFTGRFSTCRRSPSLKPNLLSKSAQIPHSETEAAGYRFSISESGDKLPALGRGNEAGVRSIDNSGRVNLPCSIHYEFQHLV